MLKRLHLRNFTVFADAEFEFGEGLNVLVGTNNTGKTHVLKIGYVMQTNVLTQLRQSADTVVNQPRVRKGPDLWFFDDKLINVFQPVPFEQRKLIRFKQDAALAEAEIIWLNMQISSTFKINSDSI